MVDKVTYEVMVQQLQTMPQAEIDRHLIALGCKLTYHDIKERLQYTYNDLEVADGIFSCYKINDDHSPYPVEFIDEAVLAIAMREDFGFEHYGILSTAILEASKICDEKTKVDEMERLIRKVMKLAQKFQQRSLEGMIYKVNDGVDLFVLFVEALDDMQVLARKDKNYAMRIVKLVDKYLQVFDQTNPFAKITLEYEQAQAYIALKSKKGEQIFLRLLKTHSDKTDVVFHYGLAYIDDDEAKTLKIFDRYRNLLNKESEVYDLIQEIIADSKED